MTTATELKIFNIFNGLNDEQLTALATLATEQQFAADSFIFHEGELAHSAYLLKQGLVALSIALPNDKLLTVHTCSAGEIFAWTALIGCGNNLAFTAKTVEESQLIAIPGDALIQQMDSDVALEAIIYRHIACTVASRLHDTRAQLANLLYG